MLMRLMSSMGEADTILRHPDLLDSLVDAARDPVAAAANVAEFQALLSPLGPRAATRIRPDDLRRVAVRTLMIWGDHDPVVSVADAREVAQADPGRPPRGAASGTRAPAREPAARRSAAAGLHSISSLARVSCSKAALPAHTPTVSKIVKCAPLPTGAAARAQTGQLVDGHA